MAKIFAFIAFICSIMASLLSSQHTLAYAAGTVKSPPTIIYDSNHLPFPVRQMRERIINAAKSGNIEELRPLFRFKNGTTRILPDGTKQDVIAYLKEISADGQGLEILANLLQILHTGAINLHKDAEETYVWPYFFALSPKALSKKQLVEAYQLMSVDDLETIKEIGHYIYFRVGIGSDGSWRFFLTGDADNPEGEEGVDKNDPVMPKRPNTIPLPNDSDDLPADQ